MDEAYKESFLPLEENPANFETKAPKPEKKFSFNEKRYKQLSLAEKSRENDLNIYGPASDDVEVLLFQLGKDVELFRNKLPEEIQEAKESKIGIINIRLALTREQELIKEKLMEAKEKQKILEQLRSIADRLKQKKFAAALLKNSAELEFLHQIFSQRFSQLWQEQSEYNNLSEQAIDRGF
ncbi:MAG: hypothetical protein A2Y67_04150 [Candidatus Buchananbacteria bacterium RBG_13_39_9]|uniref:Uncharacterized protein n=1 Tax=Candidatus Buchananbacteria bacterium RBG_13_39_9 TaxID=1797531 RepID=A0A1G1XNX2_9BACT|nr:MAG: hypothetical protein A2Y67_04150 [Candidatus Buchananbacteria bacterium RBG_13_39_9]